jgi:hypothetical protein
MPSTAADLKKAVVRLEARLLKALGNELSPAERQLVDRCLLSFIKSGGRVDKHVQSAIKELRAHVVLKTARIEHAEDNQVSIEIVPVKPSWGPEMPGWVPPAERDAPKSKPEAPAAPTQLSDSEVWERLVSDEPAAPTEPEAQHR